MAENNASVSITPEGLIDLDQIRSAIGDLASRVPEIKRIAMDYVPPLRYKDSPVRYENIQPRPAPFCRAVVAAHGPEICNESVRRHILLTASTKKGEPYVCPYGLTDFVIPLFWKRIGVGSIVGGQIIPPPGGEGRERFEANARELGIDIAEAEEAMLTMPMGQVRMIVGLLELWLDSLVADNALAWFMRSVAKDARGEDKDAEATMASIVDLLQRLVGAAACSIFIFDPLSGRLVLRATSSKDEDMIEAIGQPEKGYEPGVRERRGLTGWVYRFQRPLLVHNVRDAKELDRIREESERIGIPEPPEWVGLLREAVPGQFLGVPMANGVLRISESAGSDLELTSKDKELLAAAAHLVDAVVAEATASGHVAIYGVGEAIFKSRGIRELLRSAAEIATRQFGCATTQICRLDPGGESLGVEVIHGIDPTRIRGLRYDMAARGIAVHVAKTGETVRTEKASDHPNFSGIHDGQLVPLLRQHGQSPGGSVLCGPIFGAAGNCLGVIKLIGKTGRRGFSFEDQVSLKTLAPLVGIALEDIEAQDIVQISRMMFKLAEEPSPHDAAQIIIDTAMVMMPTSALGYIVLSQGPAGRARIRVEACSPPDLDLDVDRLNKKYLEGHGVVYRVVTTKEPFCGSVEDAKQLDTGYVECREGIQSEIAVALIAGDESLGAINMESEKPGNYDEQRDVKRLQILAGYAAAMFKNVMLGEFTRQLASSAVHSLGRVRETLQGIKEALG